MTQVTVDLNSDMGEGFGPWTMGDDDAILDIVSSANVACGFHGGDPEIMAHTFAEARKRGVAIGAHPGYPDLWGFGRRVIPHSAGEIERFTAYQIGAAQALAAYAGHRITYVKAHGALGNLSSADPEVARAVARAVAAVDPSLELLAIARSEQVAAGEAAGLTVRSEIFADRAYLETGLLVPRSEPGAVIHDADQAAARMVRMVTDGALETVAGTRLPCAIESICVHSDTPGAVALAARVRAALEAEGITIAPFAPG
ncbi:MAG: UPF0271 protein [Rhodobacteraceae bacterium HLUCCA08]|nr:MAG: UPF0271 protein [Rhodobacteraceae bacterium HLUCCA08]